MMPSMSVLRKVGRTRKWHNANIWRATKKWRMPSERMNLPSTMREMSEVRMRAMMDEENVDNERQRAAANRSGEDMAEKIAGVIRWLT